MLFCDTGKNEGKHILEYFTWNRLGESYQKQWA